MEKHNILIIGGYDPTGGAGVIADAKTAKVLGVNPLTITTSIIPQNNKAVYNKVDIPKKVIKEQLDAIFEDFDVSIVKTGVLNEDAINLILKYKKDYDFKIVCDPVLKSTTNYEFVDENLLEKHVDLFNECYLITPNEEEFNTIINFIEKNNLWKKFDKNPYVLVTGTNDKLITLKDKNVIETIKGKKIDKEVHGTGCVFSSAIASFLCRGEELIDAIKKAKDIVLASVVYATKTKYGYNSNPTYINKEKVIKNLSYALYLLKKINFSLIPEVGSNIAESLLLPNSFKDVAALTGRIIKNKLGGFYIVGDIEFGASEHIAKIILAAKNYDPQIRACMNIRYDEDLIDVLSEKFSISSFDRKLEPPNVSTMEWGTKYACEKFGGVPDIIYDKGGDGKEPMIRVLGVDAIDVVKKVAEIQRIYDRM
ncbi:thiamine-phosphate synthase family protein [Methanotorris igneus]|uniref:Bifunctional thiamine biosynthesis protein ThiDN n=1 Tax=Methanotorris igneus (strain DSM 5666 / JCM 11834 / Kol 5) TaxID=880724 RepID=F6BD11_METIK|nr:thiamine-phosphate synthase family protein [Methanotorris igneus]AEF96372.1 Phosphomethylpyrimidine kinase [Methanotorris igneus Kol 5]